MYTANIGPFRAVGKPPNNAYSDLRAAVTVDTTLYVPSTMYEELGGTPGADTYPSGSEYVDEAIRNDWVRVVDPVPGSFDDDYADAVTVVEQARHDAHHVIAQMTNHPKTVNEWNDTAIVGVAVRFFERNEQIRVIVHTTDRALQKAVQVVVPHYGYYDVKARYYPPKTVKDLFPVKENFVW